MVLMKPLPPWAENLRKYRKGSGLSQARFGKMFGVTAMAVSYWESGRTEPPASVLVWLLIAAGVLSRSSLTAAGFEL